MSNDESPNPELTRRRFLVWSAASAAAVALAACEFVDPSPTPSPGPSTAPPTATPGASSPASPAVSAGPTGTPTVIVSPAPPAAGRRTLYRNGALADARSDRLDIGVSILVEGGIVRWIRPRDDEGELGPRDGLERVDASGAVFVPGMVDAHSHLTMPGGAHWVDRGADDPAALLEVAERNGRLLTGAGVRWARDVGAPYVDDPSVGRRQALSIGVRDRWRDQPGFPKVRVAGTWLTRTGSLPNGLRRREADNADELVQLATEQLDDGADLLKLYLDGPDSSASPWSASDIRRVVELAHGRGATVTAHSGTLVGARAGVQGGVDAIEHGYVLDADVCAEMARARHVPDLDPRRASVVADVPPDDEPARRSRPRSSGTASRGRRRASGWHAGPA